MSVKLTSLYCGLRLIQVLWSQHESDQRFVTRSSTQDFRWLDLTKVLYLIRFSAWVMADWDGTMVPHLRLALDNTIVHGTATTTSEGGGWKRHECSVGRKGERLPFLPRLHQKQHWYSMVKSTRDIWQSAADEITYQVTFCVTIKKFALLHGLQNQF